MTTTAEAASPLPHEEMPGRSQASSSPSGGLTRSGTYGGALKGATPVARQSRMHGVCSMT